MWHKASSNGKHTVVIILLFAQIWLCRIYVLYLSAIIESALAAIFSLLASEPQGTV